MKFSSLFVVAFGTLAFNLKADSIRNFAIDNDLNPALIDGENSKFSQIQINDEIHDEKTPLDLSEFEPSVSILLAGPKSGVPFNIT